MSRFKDFHGAHHVLPCVTVLQRGNYKEKAHKKGYKMTQNR